MIHANRTESLYKLSGGKVKGSISKLSEGLEHKFTEAWPASKGQHHVPQSIVTIHQVNKGYTLKALAMYGLCVLVVLFLSRIHREERLAQLCSL